jgi:hypothetical protein
LSSIGRLAARRFCWLALLWLHATAASAHLSGFTDTSIQIAQPGVKIIYTLPADNLLELGLPQQRADTAIKEPRAYLEAVAQGWSVQAKKRSCFQNSAEASALRTIESYQYTLVFECPQGFDEMVIRYALFGEQWRGEQNFTRVFMAGEQLRMRFTFDKQELPLAVPELLKNWGKSLQPEFLTLDPNRKLRKDAWTGFASAEPVKDSVGWWQSLLRADPAFIVLGLKHILLGADHILFVIGLLLVPAGLARLAGLVTAFTVAHSITLSLAVLNVVALPPSITEPLIALTVAAIGAENMLRTRWFAGDAERVTQIRGGHSRRWLPTFGFGLIHGVGLSYVLSEMGMADDLAGTLVYFNVGVELGQLSIVAICLPITLLIFRRPWGLRASTVLSGALTLLGLYWFAERTFG